jgi:hypothetical protein
MINYLEYFYKNHKFKTHKSENALIHKSSHLTRNKGIFKYGDYKFNEKIFISPWEDYVKKKYNYHKFQRF